MCRKYLIKFRSCLITIILFPPGTFYFVFSQRSIEKRTGTNQLAHHSKLFFSMAMAVPLLRPELCVFPLFIKRPLEAVQIQQRRGTVAVKVFNDCIFDCVCTYVQLMRITQMFTKDQRYQTYKLCNIFPQKYSTLQMFYSL